MADTGAPWNLPYPVSSDLVRDGAQAIEDLADAVATGLSAASVVKQVVSTVKTNTFTTTSTSFVDITGLTATLTPSAVGNKVLIIAQVAWGIGNNAIFGQFRLSGGNATAYVGDAAGSRVRGVFGGSTNADNDGGLLTSTLVYLDSPSSTSPVTYSAQAKSRVTFPGTVYINRTQNDDDSDDTTRGASSITVIEVAA
jgi:hypothetical protein